ncbi:single-stranded DNA-binding protein [Aerococcus urinaeequi]|uniref:single-stranded DNA-binding protein n=1 Tax=Aerococcus urinaeequi TaxID=51665 RepID=UPI00367310C5
MINNVTIIGRTTKDIELRATSSGTNNASFTLAVERNFKNANGEKETDFINCVAWRKTAEIVAQYAPKGSMIGVRGRIQTRNYENNQGVRVYVTEIVADEVQLIDTRNNNQGANANYYQNNENNGGFNGGQQQSSVNTNDPFQNSVQGGFNMNNNALEVDSSDLPF